MVDEKISIKQESSIKSTLKKFLTCQWIGSFYCKIKILKWYRDLSQFVFVSKDGYMITLDWSVAGWGQSLRVPVCLVISSGQPDSLHCCKTTILQVYIVKFRQKWYVGQINVTMV